MPSLDQLGENAILKQLLVSLPTNQDLITGPGDDCAVIKRDEQWDTLFKTDVVVENIHFTRETPPDLIGRKALARALSDIAAMGGTPEHALVSLIVHPTREMEEIEKIYQGISKLAQEWNVSLAGGETSSLPQDGLIINISLLGKVPAGQAVLRSTARPGDLIAVTGELGDTLETGHHLNFIPRIVEGNILRQYGIATAMMDLSDGLITDLERLCNVSETSFILNAESLPCRNGCSSTSAHNAGEDYELLFSLNPHNLNKLQHLTQNNILRTRVTVIGQIIPASLPQESNPARGWEHFVIT